MIEQIRQAVEKVRESHPNWTGFISRTPEAQPLMAKLYTPSLTQDEGDATWWLGLRDGDSALRVEGKFTESPGDSAALLEWFTQLQHQLELDIKEAERVLAVRPEANAL